jgi:predicted dehydrogenase
MENSTSAVSRRHFIQTASLAALAAACPSAWAQLPSQERFKNLIPKHRKLRIACIGLGGKGHSDVMNSASEEIVALCDVDFARGAETFARFPNVPRYRDYRQMLREMDRKIDAVTVSTPDHTHFPAALMAIQMGKHVYVQKPLTHTIGEARALKAAALKAGVVTQMGNQGHANDGTRLLKEWIDAGVIGAVHEVHAWTNRPSWAQAVPFRETAPVPDTLDWNLWQGSSPVCDYSPKLAPFGWRGFWDYGCGALGDMGCHILDAPFWALNLRGPAKVSAISEGNTETSCPKWSIVTWEFPARGDLPPLTMKWYDGGNKPPVPEELGPDGKLGNGGVIYKGTLGTMLSEGDYGSSPRLIPEEKLQAMTHRPPRVIPRVPKADPHMEWINACKGGPVPGSNIIDHSADLTEMVALGNLAIRLGKPIEWDPIRGACVGMPEANRFIHKNYRLF